MLAISANLRRRLVRRRRSISGRAITSCPGAAFALGLGVLLLVPLVAIALARMDEIAAIAFGRPPRRLAVVAAAGAGRLAPKVSIHIPACCEPPDMLKATLDSVARLDYPNLECVVVINNTPDPALWRPVEEHCRTLGERFKFVRAENLTGYKAGALRLALAHTAPDAEIIGVSMPTMWSSRTGSRTWCRCSPTQRVGLVQSPQDHRDGDRSLMHRAMNAEYAGFFDIGMVQRNEVNAIIVHGTMCLIRRAAMESAGGWSSDTIVEDADLGLTLLEHGWIAHYTNRRYGYGLLPDTFEAYKRQRHRWAFGGLADPAQALAAAAAGRGRAHPRAEARIRPRLAQLARRRKHRRRGRAPQHPLGAGRRVRRYCRAGPHPDGSDPGRLCGLGGPLRGAVPAAGAGLAGQMLGAVFAAMSVQWTVARAVGIGLFKERLPFLRTAKGGVSRKGPDFPAFWEAVIAGLLLAGRGHARRHQRQAGARDQHLRRGACGAEPAVPVGGRDRAGSKARASTRSPSGAGSRPRRLVLLPRPQGHRRTARSCRPRTASKRRSSWLPSPRTSLAA